MLALADALQGPAQPAVMACLAVACGMWSWRKGSRRDGAIDALAVCLVWAFDTCMHNPMCGLMFQCRCTFALHWSDGWKMCNVNDPGEPHCPFCACTQYLGGYACLLVRDLVVVLVALGTAAALTGRPRLLCCQLQTESAVRPGLLAVVAPLLAWTNYTVACGAFFFLVLAPEYPDFFWASRE